MSWHKSPDDNGRGNRLTQDRARVETITLH